VSAERYEIHVKGRLSETVLAAFEDLSVNVPVETVLTGQFTDQAALFGVLARIEGLGLELVGVRRLPRTERPARASPASRDAG
jgi:hypothetical protein